jgi:hypothetical protein
MVAMKAPEQDRVEFTSGRIGEFFDDEHVVRNPPFGDGIFV